MVPLPGIFAMGGTVGHPVEYLGWGSKQGTRVNPQVAHATGLVQLVYREPVPQLQQPYCNPTDYGVQGCPVSVTLQHWAAPTIAKVMGMVEEMVEAILAPSLSQCPKVSRLTNSSYATACRNKTAVQNGECHHTLAGSLLAFQSEGHRKLNNNNFQQLCPPEL